MSVCEIQRGKATAGQKYMHAWSAVSKVKGHHSGLANIPAAAVAGILFCIQLRDPEPNTTCHLLVSQSACPLLLGPGVGGREEAGWRVNGWLGGQVTWQHRPLFLPETVESKGLSIQCTAKEACRPIFQIINACCPVPCQHCCPPSETPLPQEAERLK